MSVLSTPVFLLWQVFNQDSDERVDALFEKLNEAIKKGDVSVVGAFADMLKTSGPAEGGTAWVDNQLPHVPNAPLSPIHAKLRETLKHFFHVYDKDGSGFIDEKCV